MWFKCPDTGWTFLYCKIYPVRSPEQQFSTQKNLRGEGEDRGGHDSGVRWSPYQASPFRAVLTEAGRDVCDLTPRPVPGVNWNSDTQTSGRHSGPHIWLWPSHRDVSDINSRPVYCHLICAVHLLWPYKVAAMQLVNVYQLCNMYSLIDYLQCYLNHGMALHYINWFGLWIFQLWLSSHNQDSCW